MISRKLNLPKIHSRHSSMKKLICRFIRFPFMLCFCFFFSSHSDNGGSFATDHQPYAAAASSSYHVLLPPLKERRSLLISCYPEAQLSLFFAREAFVVDLRVLEPALSLSALASFSLTRSARLSPPPPPASDGSPRMAHKCLFMVPPFEHFQPDPF